MVTNPKNSKNQLIPTNYTYQVPKKLAQICRQFAKNSLESIKSSYQTDLNSIKIIEENIYIGKLGELAVLNYLKQSAQFHVFKKPDFNIYYGGDKDWSPDLTFSPIDRPQLLSAHVKTQSITSRELYTKSWAFQYGKYRKDPLLDNPTERDYIFLVSQIGELEFEIDIIAKMKYIIKNGLLKSPKISKYSDEKRIIYYEDVIYGP